MMLVYRIKLTIISLNLTIMFCKIKNNMSFEHLKFISHLTVKLWKLLKLKEGKWLMPNQLSLLLVI